METREQVIRQAVEIYSLLVDMANTVGDDGSAVWFCAKYPFGTDLESVTASIGEWIHSMKGGQ
jgi:hypothetical protein